MPDHRSDTPTGPQPGSIVVVAGPVGVGKSTVSRLVAAAFDRSVHLQVDDVMASIVSGWIDPNLPEAADQNEAIGGALAVSAMGFAQHGYTAVVDGSLFPDGVAGLAEAASARGLSCHYAVLHADLTTCWARAERRGQATGRSNASPSSACTRGTPPSTSTSATASTPPDRRPQ